MGKQYHLYQIPSLNLPYRVIIMKGSGSALVSSQRCNKPRKETSGTSHPLRPTPNSMRTKDISSLIVLRCVLLLDLCQFNASTICKVKALFQNRNTPILSFTPSLANCTTRPGWRTPMQNAFHLLRRFLCRLIWRHVRCYTRLKSYGQAPPLHSGNNLLA